MTTLHVVVTIYFVANAFVTSYLIGEFINPNKFKAVLVCIVCMLIGLPAAIVILIWGEIYKVLDKIGVIMAFNFHIMKEFSSLSKKQLGKMNKLSETHFNKDKFSDRRYRYWLGKINERNKYGIE